MYLIQSARPLRSPRISNAAFEKPYEKSADAIEVAREGAEFTDVDVEVVHSRTGEVVWRSIDEKEA